MTNRVLHVFTAMNVGGAETMVLNLYRAIDRGKIQFDFLVHSEEIGYYEKEILTLGGRIFRLPYPKLKYIKSYQKQLYKLLSKNKFCAIHSHAHSFSGFILETAKKVPISIRIAHSHTTSGGKKATLFRKIYQSYMKSNLKTHATHRFACSSTAGEALFGKDAETIVLPNGFNLQEYEQLSQRQITDSLTVGHIGRFDCVKNHLFFLETFYYFKKNHPHASAILVGNGPEKEKIKDLIQFYELQDSVKLLGIRADIPQILSQFNLFLFPSLYEGLGNVVIEAQAAGVPCLVSDTVPKEVDLSINLVTFKNLNDGAEPWAKELETIIRTTDKPEWETRKSNLKLYGYDAWENAKYLEMVYIGS